MHNWRFLLLAFVAVFQPIASYAEGLVDGRQQRCDLRTASLRRDPGLPFHGTHRFTKPLDARCLSERDVRAVRRNELREDHRSIKTTERRLVDTLESRGKTSRLGSTQAENRLAIDNIIQRRETRAQFRSEDRNQRNREIERDRLSITSDTRRNRFEKSRHSNRLEDEIRINSRRSIGSRTSMESRRDSERYRDSTSLQRAQEIRVTRAVSERARDDEAVSSRRRRERVQEMRHAELSVQQERNGERQILNRGSRNTEPRSSSFPSVRVYRAYNNEESRRDTQSLGWDERLNTRSRRSINGKPQLDRRITSQDRVSAERKIIRDSPERSEHRRVLGERDARQLGRQRFVEERSTEWDRDTRLTRATRFEANRVSRNLRTDALLEQRARSVENRRNARDIRNMELNFRSGERSIENQRAYRLADRESVTDNRREIRNINRESRVVTQNRAADSNRKVHNIVRESREIRNEADKDTESCSLNRERSTERRMTGQDSERVSRILTARRDAQNQNNIRNKEDARVLGRERSEVNRNVDRDSRIFGGDHTTERNIRMNLVGVRSANKERSWANQRDTRNAEFQRVRVERSSRRDVRNIGRLTSSLERVINHVDTRDNVRESRKIEKRASSETRANRDSRRDFRTATHGRRESRNVERQSRNIGDKLIIDNLRTTRFVDRDSARRERSAESRRDIRQVQLPQVTVNRRERAAENRVIRNVDRDTRAFRTVEARTASRVDTENIRYNDLKARENSRVAERLNMRGARRSRSVRESNIEARRNSDRNNFEMERREAESRYRFNTELARKREFLNTIKNTQAESETSAMNWQYLLYTLQGLYICGILSQLMNERTAGKKPRALSWYSTPQHLIKVD